MMVSLVGPQRALLICFLLDREGEVFWGGIQDDLDETSLDAFFSRVAVLWRLKFILSYYQAPIELVQK